MTDNKVRERLSDAANEVTDLESFYTFVSVWNLEIPDSVRDDLHIDLFLARLSEEVREYDGHLLPGAPGEPAQPTWRWYAEVLVRAVHGPD